MVQIDHVDYRIFKVRDCINGDYYTVIEKDNSDVREFYSLKEVITDLIAFYKKNNNISITFKKPTDIEIPSSSDIDRMEIKNISNIIETELGVALVPKLRH